MQLILDFSKKILRNFGHENNKRRALIQGYTVYKKFVNIKFYKQTNGFFIIYKRSKHN